MGAQAQTALALAVVPFGLDSKMEEELFQMLAGALPVLNEAGCALVGGHTCEGQEASLGKPRKEYTVYMYINLLTYTVHMYIEYHMSALLPTHYIVRQQSCWR